MSCESFLTDPSFRQVHEDQLAQTKRLRDNAERGGRVRLVELLQHDETALVRILTGLDGIEADAAEPTADAVDLLDIAKDEA